MASFTHLTIKTGQEKNSIAIKGSCYNVATGVDLKTKAFVLSGDKKILLGESNSLGLFNLQLPTSAKYVSFEADGFRPVIMATNITGRVENESRFIITVPMSAIDSVATEPINQLALFFTVPDSLAIRYEIKQIRNPTHHYGIRFKSGRHPTTFLLKNFIPRDYVLTALAEDGHTLLNEEINANSGLNFKEVIIRKGVTLAAPGKSIVNRANEMKSPSSLVVYFAQSSYALTSEAKTRLDSVSNYMSTQSTLRARIAGYTDNVGEPKLNLTLSEYRARAVVNYLQSRSIQSNRLFFIDP